MKKQTVVIFYLLSIYIFLQFSWWTYHLVDLTSQIQTHRSPRNQMLMILGEGTVFFLLLIIGLWRIRTSIQKEMLNSEQQNNFLLSVTHELKTPLTAIKLYLQTLLKREELDRPQQEQLLKGAIEENKRLEEMINNILTATQIENRYVKPNLEKINLSGIVTHIVKKWETTRCVVQLDIEPDVFCKIDRFIIETVLHNLLDNAYKYSSNKPEIIVYLHQEGSNVIWGVKDKGKGIPVSNRKNIFSRFVRIGNEETRTQKGTGLGLFIVRNLLLAQGNRIEYLPNQPQGSNFKITTPL